MPHNLKLWMASLSINDRATELSYKTCKMINAQGITTTSFHPLIHLTECSASCLFFIRYFNVISKNESRRNPLEPAESVLLMANERERLKKRTQPANKLLSMVISWALPLTGAFSRESLGNGEITRGLTWNNSTRPF